MYAPAGTSHLYDDHSNAKMDFYVSPERMNDKGVAAYIGRHVPTPQYATIDNLLPKYVKEGGSRVSSALQNKQNYKVEGKYRKDEPNDSYAGIAAMLRDAYNPSMN